MVQSEILFDETVVAVKNTVSFCVFFSQLFLLV